MNQLSRDLIEAAAEHPVLRRIAGQSFLGKVYLVGGAVREMLLAGKPNDYDLALTDARDIGCLENLFEARSFLLGKKPIRTYRLVTSDASLDITIVDGTIESDLARRDFTMNAIALDLKNNAVIDVVGGMDDIARRVIRYPSQDALVHDPLRMLKAIRHFATLEDFTIDDSLSRSIGELKHLIRQSAPERIKYEMDRIIVSPLVAEAIRILDKTNLLFEIFPELYPLRQMDIEKGFILETLGHTLDGFRFLHPWKGYAGVEGHDLQTVGYAFLFHDLGKARTYSYDTEKQVVHFFYHERFSIEMATEIMERLRFSVHQARDVLALIEGHMRIFLISNNEPREKAIRRLVYKIKDLTPSLILHTLCDMYGSSAGIDNPSTEQVRKCCDEIKAIHAESRKTPLAPLVNGHDLIGMGFRQGPLLGACLTEIRDKQIAKEMATKDEALSYAAARLKDNEVRETS